MVKLVKMVVWTLFLQTSDMASATIMEMVRLLKRAKNHKMAKMKVQKVLYQTPKKIRNKILCYHSIKNLGIRLSRFSKDNSSSK